MLRRARSLRLVCGGRRLASGAKKGGGVLGALRGSRVAGQQGQADLQLAELIQADQKARLLAAEALRRAQQEQPDADQAAVPDGDEQAIEQELARAAQEVAASLAPGGAAGVKSALVARLAAMERETFEACRPAPAPASSSLLAVLNRLARQPAQPDDRPATGDDSALLQARKFLDELDLRVSHRDRRLTSSRQQPARLAEAAPRAYEQLAVYEGERLAIFGPSSAPDANADQGSVWDRLERKRLGQLLSLAPRNGFEEMVDWTESGKLHPYPVDNEWGLAEKRLGFQEHVFLHRLLAAPDAQAGRVPASGPVRDFLDLVLAGLARNPFMALERKHQHVAWFRRFFSDKQDELQKLRQHELGQ